MPVQEGDAEAGQLAVAAQRFGDVFETGFVRAFEGGHVFQFGQGGVGDSLHRELLDCIKRCHNLGVKTS